MISKLNQLELKLIFEELSYFSVESVSFDPIANCLRIYLGATDEKSPNAAIALFNPTLCLFSKVLDDEFPFIIGELNLVELQDGGKEMFTKLGYAFREREEIAFYPSRKLYHFRLEGGLCLEVICAGYEILRSVC